MNITTILVGIGSYLLDRFREVRRLWEPHVFGVEVTQANAAAGVYPVTRKLFMNTKGEPTGLTAAFIAFVQGPRGARIVQDSGYIPLTAGH